ncbi:TetR/AcrR family transcriptional regulator [Clostridium saccharoperbutylacetonicum]|uniref:TetR/AcrR family transcriptional regulator n=1 Tax=Clostridium saccharoperbutylacetonicum TaxID=36745 RepID=UPI0039ED7B86
MADRRITKSQLAIKQAFIELMEEIGFEKITIQDISDRANIGRRTFYHHYLDKYDLLSKLIEDHIEELRIICPTYATQNNPGDPFGWFTFFEEHYSFFSIMLRGDGAFTFRPIFLDFVIEELRQHVDLSQGQNQGISEDIYFQFFGSAIVGVIEAYFTKHIHIDARELSKPVMALLNRNL